MRDSWSITWPVRWWVVVPASVAMAAYTFLSLSSVADWSYIDTAYLSSLPREMTVLLGPAVASIACLIGRSSWAKDAVATTAAQRMGPGLVGRVFLVLTLWLVGVHLGVAATMIHYYSRQATAGDPQWVALVPVICSLVFFVAIGLGVSLLVDHWSAGLVALIVSLTLALVPFPFTSEIEIMRWLAPAAPITTFSPVPGATVGWVVAYWLVGSAAVVLVLLAVASCRATSGSTSGTLRAGAAVSAWAVALVAIAVISPAVSGPEPYSAQCATRGAVTYCVSEEEAPVLSELQGQTGPVLAKLGGGPGELRWVTSQVAADALLREGQWDGDATTLVAVGVGPVSGARYSNEDLAGVLAGMTSCSQESIAAGDEGVEWTFALAWWLARPDELHEQARIGLPQPAAMEAATSAEVQHWYSLNRAELQACAYQGSGP